VTCTRTGESPVTVVEPVIDPETAKAIPDGSEPWVTRQEYGGAPPVADNAAEYGAPATPSGSDSVVIAGSAARTEKDKARVAAEPKASLTRTVAAKLPAVAGVPLIAPEEASDKPPGRLPDAILHVYGVLPPLAFRVAE
jgi:hypothetical protein